MTRDTERSLPTCEDCGYRDCDKSKRPLDQRTGCCGTTVGIRPGGGNRA